MKHQRTKAARKAQDVKLGRPVAVITALNTEITTLQGQVDTLGSNDRIAALQFDLARSWAQAEGARDAEAIRHLDAADRLAPQRIGNDPLARDLALTLIRRARQSGWPATCRVPEVGRAVPHRPSVAPAQYAPPTATVRLPLHRLNHRVRPRAPAAIPSFVRTPFPS